AARGVKTVVSKSAFVDGVRRFVPELDAESIEQGPRGVRAQAMNDDGELIDDLKTTTRGSLTVVRAVPKWGATSALAIAEAVVDRAVVGFTRRTGTGRRARQPSSTHAPSTPSATCRHWASSLPKWTFPPTVDS